MSKTFAELVQGVLKRLSPDEELIVQRATGTGADAGASLIDARLKDNTTDADPTKFTRAHVRIPAQTTPAWSEECIREIGAYTPSTGTLTPVDAFGSAYDGTGVIVAATTLTDARRTWITNEHAGDVVTCGASTGAISANTGTILTLVWTGGTPASGLPYSIGSIVPADCQYEIHRLMPPSRLKECINRVLRDLRRMVYVPFTLVTDGDMETAGVASWTASNCTPTKITTAAYVKHGSQSMRVLNTLANGYAASAAIPVIEGRTFLVVAVGRCAVGTATVQPYDDTNAAVIASDAAIWTTDEGAWFELGHLITIPSACESISIRLRGTGATDDIYWDSVIVLDVNDAILALPDWITNKNQIEGFFTFPRGSAIDDGGYVLDERWTDLVSDWLALVDESAANPWQVQVPTPFDRPIFLKALRPFAELSADGDTTVANYDEVLEGAVAYAKDDLGHPDADRKLARFGSRQMSRGERPQVTARSPWTTARGR